MTRFKEGKRIEAALAHRDKRELKWAEGYCQMRLKILTRKDHAKHWQQRLQQVQAALEAS